MYVLTAKQQKQFWANVAECVARLRVVDWTIRKKVETRCDDDPTTMADCAANWENRVAAITLYREWEAEPTDEELYEIAFHEVLHIVTCLLTHLAEERFVTQKQIDDAEHDIIRSVVSFVFKKGTTSE